MSKTPLLVIGAGPYGLSTAACAQEHGIETIIVGHPMSFWRQHMPEQMFLRSGVDWHLDAGGVHTLAAYVEEREISEQDLDPIPLGTFVDYCDWFRQMKGITVREELVTDLAKLDTGFEATLAGGDRIVADAVVCAPGIRHFTNLPDWAASVPEGLAAHTCDLVRFEAFAGARVLIVGGRQSAYEWAALIREHGAERIDVVHRHDVPRFDRVDWKFVDADVERTIQIRGYWRNLPEAERNRIGRRFWEVGRLTLEYWLTPRLEWENIHRWPGTEVVKATASGSGHELQVLLSNAERLTVDRVVFASGYRAALTRIPYLETLVGDIEQSDGFPVLDESFGTSIAGLYMTGFTATQDFGPFFGFVKASPAAAKLIVRDLASHN
ncbi:MAG TPA: NAD(P)-binding domain-containing protein [Nocardioidaceae bacterium]|nr:NAD(P)-binding domain-containing protein [Nocardioidaceae bacterium]